MSEWQGSGDGGNRPTPWLSFSRKESKMETTTQNAAPQWYDGAPATMPDADVLADLFAYRRMHCGQCRKRGMKVVPQHTLDGRYRLVCSCRTCRHVEEC